jgi:hypothetical protein
MTYFVAQDVKLGSRFGPQLVLSLTGLIHSDIFGSEICYHNQPISTRYVTVSVKSFWRQLTEVFHSFHRFPVAHAETMQAVIISLAIDFSYQMCCHSVLCMVYV